MNDIAEKIKRLEKEIDDALSYDQDVTGLEYELAALRKKAGVESGSTIDIYTEIVNHRKDGKP